MSDTGLQEYREAVLNDRELQDGLRKIDDRAEFTRQVIRHADERGFELTVDDIEEALRSGRRAWIERWI